MRQINKLIVLAIASAALLTPPARADDMALHDRLALSLRDYGLWRAEHDRNTFPTNMPKVGEPYDPVTGNAIRRAGIFLAPSDLAKMNAGNCILR